MSTTEALRNGDGTTATFTIPFEYLEESDIKVEVDDVLKTQDTDYTFSSLTEITFTAGNIPPSGTGNIRIFRLTDTTQLRNEFFAGSAIRAQDLNDDFLQNLYRVQEISERALDSTGGTVTGDVTFNNADLIFEGATADDHETTLTVTDPTADRTITLPDVTGTVVTTGDTGTVTSTMITDGTIVNDDINASAEIAVSKLGNGTARQVLQTDAAGTGVEFTDNVDLPGTLDVTGNATFDANVTASTFTGNLTGNAGTATTLETSRNIGGVSFDGSQDINLPGVNAQGNQDTTGNAATATALETARNIAGQSFDGTADITIAPTDLTDVDATAAEINQLDGIDLIPASPTWTSTTEIPSNAQISDRIAELGGFEAIADESSFPNTVPPVGVVISIGNANDLAVNGSGVGTGATVGGTSVTINGFPAEFNSTTLDDGIGLIVVKTGGDDAANQVYDFHRVLAKNEDVRQLSSDINDFKARYRVGPTNPTTDNDSGDLFFNTGSEKMLVWDGSSWDEVQSIGQFFVIPAAELADFASGTASTEVISNAPANASQIILSINGVIQQPNTGTAAPTTGFALDGSTIRLAATPPANSTVFGVIIGSSVNVGTPSAGTVDTLQLADDGVTYAKIQNIATANRVLGSTTADGEVSEVQVQTDMIADDAVTYAKMQNLANANRVLGAAAAGEIGETQVQSAMIIDDVALGGNPTTTTQSAGTNNTTIATTAYVDSAVGNLSQDSMTEGNTKAEVVDTGTDGHFLVETEGTERLRIIADGKVGIGTTTPDFTLDVVGTDAVQLPAGTDAQRPTGLGANDEGIMRFNTTSGQFEYWANTDDTPQFRLIGDAPQRTINVEYLVIAGGGSGGAGFQGGCAGGGGAGGYRTNFGSGNISGRLSAVEAAMTVDTGTALALTVGAGGTAMTGNTNSTDIPAGSDGSDSTFNTITSTGGGAGGRNDGGHGNDGGSGGGSGGRLASANPGSGTAAQGFDGGDCSVDNDRAAGGGGGAGEAGDADQTTTGTNNRTASGGDGLASSITGSSVTRAGGGGAAGDSSSCTMTTMGGLGGSGGGGNGASSDSANGTAGTANTGGGGGGNLRNCSTSNSGAGGSGVIILRTETGVTARFSAGVVVNGTTVSANNTAVAGTVVGGGSTDLVWTVTAAASDTVTFS